jgi:hypothetical protein
MESLEAEVFVWCGSEPFIDVKHNRTGCNNEGGQTWMNGKILCVRSLFTYLMEKGWADFLEGYFCRTVKTQSLQCIHKM